MKRSGICLGTTTPLFEGSSGLKRGRHAEPSTLSERGFLKQASSGQEISRTTGRYGGRQSSTSHKSRADNEGQATDAAAGASRGRAAEAQPHPLAPVLPSHEAYYRYTRSLRWDVKSSPPLQFCRDSCSALCRPRNGCVFCWPVIADRKRRSGCVDEASLFHYSRRSRLLSRMHYAYEEMRDSLSLRIIRGLDPNACICMHVGLYLARTGLYADVLGHTLYASGH